MQTEIPVIKNNIETSFRGEEKIPTGFASELKNRYTMKKSPIGVDQTYYGHGKLLLSGEYFVLDGALALALPVRYGQKLEVKYKTSFDPKLRWRSIDCNGNCWLDATFEFWRFRPLEENPSEEVLRLQNILLQVRKQNPHFLRDELDVEVTTGLEFPREWGMGSSSTLLYTIAQWAYISPFDLLFNTFGGSGHDIACAQSEGPILFQKEGNNPLWAPINFNPPFRKNIFFLYLGHKAQTMDQVANFKKIKYDKGQIIPLVGELTQAMCAAQTIEDFSMALHHHEKVVGSILGISPIKERHFSDYPGKVKSLGAWGGDFALVTVNEKDTDYATAVQRAKQYFSSKGLNHFMSYDEVVLENNATFVSRERGSVLGSGGHVLQ